jgi:hypothetical protein
MGDEQTAEPQTACRISVTGLTGAFARVMILAVGGCTTNHIVDEQAARREDNLNWTLRTLADREARSARNLEFAAGWIDERIRHDQEALERDLKWLGDELEDEFRRFEHNQPLYRDRIAEILRGKPEEIERTAIKMFY